MGTGQMGTGGYSAARFAVTGRHTGAGYTEAAGNVNMGYAATGRHTGRGYAGTTGRAEARHAHAGPLEAGYVDAAGSWEPGYAVAPRRMEPEYVAAPDRGGQRADWGTRPADLTGYPGGGASPEPAGYLGDVDSSDWGTTWDGYVYRDPGDELPPTPEADEAWAGPDTELPAAPERRRETIRRGPLAGAVAGLLSVGVLAGVSTLVAEFTGSQGSPVKVLSGLVAAQFPQSPPQLSWAILTVVAVVVALCIGSLSRRSVLPGVAGLAGISLLAGFAVIARPRAQGSDVLPTVAGGLAAIADFMWLARATVKTATAPPQGRRHKTR